VCASFNVAEYLKEMRLELDRLMEEKIAQPTLDLITYPRGKLIIDTIVKLISTE
jgi:ATP-dependent RNA helicase DHX57